MNTTKLGILKSKEKPDEPKWDCMSHGTEWPKRINTKYTLTNC